MIKLRTAETSDLPLILRIYSYYVMKTAVSFEYQLPSLEAYTKKFEKLKDKFPWLVCEIDGVAIGYAYTKELDVDAAYAWSAEISVYIDEGYHRKGFAATLYRCMEQFLLLQGFYTLYASITSTNEKSLKFHKALGFEEAGTFRNVGYKLGTWHDVVWYEKKLREYAAVPVPPKPFSALDKDVVNGILSHSESCKNKNLGNN